MDDKILIEDDIVDLTDLLEEGSPPSGASKDNSTKKKRMNEPDSFDLGKEISMEYEVSVEEIEQDTVNLDQGRSQDRMVESEVQGEEFGAKHGKEPLLDIEKEIDLAIKDKFEDVSLTSKEEEMLLKDEPAEEPIPVMEAKEPMDTELKLEEETITPEPSSPGKAEGTDADLESLLGEKPIDAKTADAGLEDLLDEKPVSSKVLEPDLESLLEDKPVPGQAENLDQVVEISETELHGIESIPAAPEVVPAAASVSASPSLAVPVETITETLIEELKKDMPALLESIIRPLVKELLQEVVVATRDALPSLVEKVIREEIDKLKKI